jgi:ATP-binding cassette subfamily B protein
MTPAKPPAPGKRPPPSAKLMGLLKPYRPLILLLVILVIAGNCLNLLVPILMSRAIDGLTQNGTLPPEVLRDFVLAAFGIFLFVYLQSLTQTTAAERVAKDLRSRLAAKISIQSNAQVETITPAKLLTNLTADVDAIKMFIATAIATLVSSFFLIIGASVLMILLNWKLALAVLGVVPFIGLTFRYVLLKVRPLFMQTRQQIDVLNRVINESILGAGLIRILNAQQIEYAKFLETNAKARDIGLSILRLFSALMPVITFAMNIAVVVILAVGGNFVIAGTMTLGEFTAFNTYMTILIYPIMLIGFMSNIMASAGASFDRISVLLSSQGEPERTHLHSTLHGEVTFENVSLDFGEKKALKNVSFTARAGSKTAIIGPTAAGKTQILHLLIGLLKPTSGRICYDGHALEDFDPEALHRQVGLVFQDSALFNLTLRENIAFSNTVSDEELEKAVRTAELNNFVDTLPQKLDSIVSERGTTLSGGQKQRVMLGRALALNPSILLLDDFTARVDTTTEQAILRNVEKNYPGITLISVTQKIAPVEHYDQIILLMESEVLACGTHEHLMQTSPEYVQVYNSQRSTSHYELHT